MLEARLSESLILKKLLDAIKDLVGEANLECTDAGISLHSLDTAHVALCTFLLRADGFESYRCDRSLSLGLSVASLSKVIKSAANDDRVTIKANEDADILNLLFESSKSERISEFDLKLMDIDADHLSIPDMEPDCTLKMSSGEFQRIVRDLSVISEQLDIDIVKGQVTFSANGDMGKGAITLKAGGTIDNKIETVIDMVSPVSLSFSSKYLLNFTKASSVSEVVEFGFLTGSPARISFDMGEIGYIRYYCAPKDEEDE